MPQVCISGWKIKPVFNTIHCWTLKASCFNHFNGINVTIDFDYLGFDPHQHTPVEILHTVLLGIVKYVWHSFITSLPRDARGIKKETRDLFVAHFQSTNCDGLNISPIQALYFIQYNNNLIGKHFKILMQTLAFHVFDLVSPPLFGLIKAVGELGALVWFHSIQNMEEYQVRNSVSYSETLSQFYDRETCSNSLTMCWMHLQLVIQSISSTSQSCISCCIFQNTLQALDQPSTSPQKCLRATTAFSGGPLC